MFIIDNELIKRAVIEDSKHIHPVLDASYSLKPIEESEIIEIAKEANKQLGYELFNDLSYSQLINDFSVVSRALTIYVMKYKE